MQRGGLRDQQQEWQPRHQEWQRPLKIITLMMVISRSVKRVSRSQFKPTWKSISIQGRHRLGRSRRSRIPWVKNLEKIVELCQSVGLISAGGFALTKIKYAKERRRKHGLQKHALATNVFVSIWKNIQKISKVLHPRVNVNVEFQGDLEMQALPY